MQRTFPTRMKIFSLDESETRVQVCLILVLVSSVVLHMSHIVVHMSQQRLDLVYKCIHNVMIKYHLDF